MRNRLKIAYTYILINIERVNKHSVTIRGLRVVTTCWSWAWSNRTSPSKWVGLGSPLAASSVYGDLTCSVHTGNNLCMFNCQCHFYLCNRGPYVRLAFMPNMLSSWNKDIIIIIIYHKCMFLLYSTIYKQSMKILSFKVIIIIYAKSSALLTVSARLFIPSDWSSLYRITSIIQSQMLYTSGPALWNCRIKIYFEITLV